MTYNKISKYEEDYKEDLLIHFLNNQNIEYRLMDFIDINEYEDDIL